MGKTDLAFLRSRAALAAVVAAILAASAGAAPTADEPAPAPTAATADASTVPAVSPDAAAMPPARPKSPQTQFIEVPIGGGKAIPPGEAHGLPSLFERFDDASWADMLKKGNALLGDVRDDTFGYDEAAFYWLVAQVAQLPPDRFQPDPEGMPYRTLLALPKDFRGQEVTLRGTYLTSVKFRVPVQALRKDVEYLYECNVREPPMEQNLPVATVIVMEDPSLYLRMGDDVRVKGYFYKVRQYEGTKGVGHAPMVIARRLEPVAGPSAEAAQSQWLLGVMFAVLAALIVSFFVIRQIVRPKRDAAGTYPVHKFRLQRDGGAEPPAGGGTPSPGGGPKP